MILNEMESQDGNWLIRLSEAIKGQIHLLVTEPKLN